MGRFDDFRKNNSYRNAKPLLANPVVQYEIQEPVERMVARMMLLDDRAHNFLGELAADSVFHGKLDVDEEWRCWLDFNTDDSVLFFDDMLDVFEDEAYDHFLKYYAEELKGISEELAAIGKLGNSLDEYKIFKTSLYNVFNNKNGLPVREYFDQVFSRAKDYGMVLERSSKEDLDLVISFSPLSEVNRGNPYYDYSIRMEFNPSHVKEGYVYSAKGVEAYSADFFWSGPVDLPVYGQYAKFEEHANKHFLSERHSLYYYEALKAQRTAEKDKYNIPADYFEGTYIDTKKLIDVSEKSYRYGDSDIYIPKSQVAFAGDKLYMKRWLFYKLKEQVFEYERQAERQSSGKSVEQTLSEAEQRSVNAPQSDAGVRSQALGDRESIRE